LNGNYGREMVHSFHWVYLPIIYFAISLSVGAAMISAVSHGGEGVNEAIERIAGRWGHVQIVRLLRVIICKGRRGRGTERRGRREREPGNK
jgi:hypothetical protein